MRFQVNSDYTILGRSNPFINRLRTSNLAIWLFLLFFGPNGPRLFPFILFIPSMKCWNEIDEERHLSSWNERKIFIVGRNHFSHENETKDRISRWFDARNDIFFLDECDTLSAEKLRFLIKIPGDNYCRVLFFHLRDLLLIRDIYWRSGM